jgi:Uma2 family endonuclease
MALPDVEVHRWTRQEYEKAAYAGAFGDRWVELVDGVVYDMPPQDSPHATGVTKTQRALTAAFGSGFTVRQQMPLRLSRLSMPEPDLAVVPGEPDDYGKAHPKTAELVVEVTDISQYHDRVRKMGLYALAGIQDYWIVNLAQDALEVHREPLKGDHHQKLTVRRGERIAPLACPEGPIAVDDLLPKR